MTTLADIRKQYPQYSDVSDADLVNGFYNKFYSDMPKEEFYKAINYKVEPERGRPTMANDPRRLDVEQPRSVGQEIGRQAALTGRTLYEAFTSPATAVLDFGAGAYNLGANLIGSESRLPYSSQRQAETLNQLGLPQPETTAEKIGQGGIAGLAGEVGTAKIAPALATNLARSLPAAAAGGAVAQPATELATEITGNPLVGQAVGMGSSLVAGGAAGKAGGMLEPKTPTNSIAEVRARAAKNYRTLDESGVSIKPKSVLDMLTDTRSELQNANMIPGSKEAEFVNVRLKEMENIVGTTGVSFNKLEKLRQIANDMKANSDPSIKRFGSIIVDQIDGYTNTLNGKDLIAGKDGLDATVKAVREARKDWRAASKAQVLQDVFDVAEMRADNPKKSEAELIRSKLEDVLANKNKRAAFTDAEVNQMRSVVAGGPIETILSIFARFDPRRSHLSSMAQGGAIAYDPSIGIPIAIGGAAADTALGVFKKKQAENLIRTIASGTAKDVPNYKYSGLLGGVVSNPQEDARRALQEQLNRQAGITP